MRSRRAVAVASRGGDEHVHDCRGARQALAIYVTLCLIRTEARPHNFDRSPVTALAACLYANGRALIAGTLQAASTSAIMSDRSSWLRLPPCHQPTTHAASRGIHAVPELWARLWSARPQPQHRAVCSTAGSIPHFPQNTSFFQSFWRQRSPSHSGRRGFKLRKPVRCSPPSKIS